MLSAPAPTSARTAAEALPRKKFTRQEMERLLEIGFFADERFELIDGELVDKMGQNPLHASAIRRISKWLRSVFGEDRVQVQLPIEALGEDRDRSVPEPDAAVLAELKSAYDRRHPRGDELLLVVEAADTSAAFDLTRKAALYAGSRVPEYWVLDLDRRMLVVHRQSDGTQYRLIQTFSEDQTVSLEGHAAGVKVSEFLAAANQQVVKTAPADALVIST